MEVAIKNTDDACRRELSTALEIRHTLLGLVIAANVVLEANLSFQAPIILM